MKSKWNNRRVRCALLFYVVLSSGISCGVDKPDIVTADFRVMLAPGIARSTAIYGVIKNTGTVADTLVGLSSNAGTVMLHQTVINAGRARMDHFENHKIKSNEALELKPLSYHIMLINIDHNLVKEGGSISLTLQFSISGELQVVVPVVSNN